jgi:kynurenine formamidase
MCSALCSKSTRPPDFLELLRTTVVQGVDLLPVDKAWFPSPGVILHPQALVFKARSALTTGPMVRGKRTVDEIPLADLLVPAVVIDVRDKVMAHPDYQLSAEDVRSWEARNGTIPAGFLVILNTGWHKRYGDPKRYINMDANRVMHFPGYGKVSAELLVRRNVVGIGIDTFSPDHGPSKDLPIHGIMLGANRYIIENMSNLDALPLVGATVIIGVLPVRDGS